MTLPIPINTPADVLQSVITGKKSAQFRDVIAESGYVPVDFSTPELIFIDHLIALTASGLLQVNHLSEGLTSHQYHSLPGQVLIFPAGTSIQCNHSDVSYSCLKLTPHIVNQAVGEVVDISQVELQPNFKEINQKKDPLLKHLLVKCIEGMQGDSSLDHLYIESLINTLILHIYKNYSAQKKGVPACVGGLSPYQLRCTIDYVETHLGQEIKLADIAELLGMSQYHFCRLFRQSMGFSPYQYVIQKRVEQAKKMLRQLQNTSIAAIALECGFSSQSSLCKHFRNLTGVTPKAYRRGM